MGKLTVAINNARSKGAKKPPAAFNPAITTTTLARISKVRIPASIVRRPVT
jgi:hypothetical protein